MARFAKLLTGYTVTDEIITRTDSTALALYHGTIRGTADLNIYTGPGATGTHLALTTDYTVSAEDTVYTAEAGVAIYTKLAIINGAYQNTTLYVNYKTIGDYASAAHINDLEEAMAIPGDIKTTMTLALQAGWLRCDGAAVSRTTYADLYSAISISKGVFTVSQATPAVFTLNGHGLATGDNVELTTTGALYTGLAANTNYFAIYINANTFNLATSLANALAGTKIATSGSQSGVHSLRYVPFGISGASNFSLPDMRETSPYGVGTRGSGVTAHDAAVLGQMKDDQEQGHAHQLHYRTTSTFDSNGVLSANSSGGTDRTPGGALVTDGTNGTPRIGTVTRGKIIGVNYVIKT